MLIYFCLNAWPDAYLSRVLTSSFGPTPLHGELRSHFLWRVAVYALGWFLVFSAIGAGTYWATTEYGLEFKYELEKLVYHFFLGRAVVLTMIVAIRSIVARLFLKITRRDYFYLVVDDSSENAA